jgi:hypothetical protein
MKNKLRFTITPLIILLALSPDLFAQESTYQPAPLPPPPPQVSYYAFDKGTNVLDLGLGLGGYYNYWGSGYYQTPNFVISYENGTFGNVGPGVISLGGLFSYKGISDNYVGADGYTYSNTWNYWILGFRSAYHLQIPDAPRFDPYAGVMLGYYYLGHTFTTSNPNYTVPGNPGYVYYTATYPSYAALSMYLGARYALSNRVSIWGELGYGYTNFALGVGFKL